MTKERTKVGREVEDALGEALAHIWGEGDLPSRIVDAPKAVERALAERTASGEKGRTSGQRPHKQKPKRVT